MKAVILAGGLGTRLSEETATRPKPMVEIGGRPILWHIMKGYSHHGINDFVICLGYKGYIIKEYFANYFLHMSDVTMHIAENRMEIHRKTAEPWTVTLVDTGDQSMTGGRLKRVRHHLEGEEMFALTYGDGVSDVDVTAQIAFHRAHGKRATVTAVRPDKRFGYLALDGDRVTAFEEKPDNEGGWINGGFFLLAPSVIDTVTGDETVWEREPLERLAREGDLQAFIHDGFWQAMDTLRDKTNLEALWASGRAPWKTW
ncbi:glucose-1-phosphate cytidylyltransferase [Methylobacterium sp. PvP062]|uniref:Glucose-1-phosphate cytidylyltransferase n=1 Tax=Methylobacterium radiotolerans TaxID=31998 RepID=A0ABV2N919_9HYPH|nr:MULTISPECIES: glucose-1-phosphate cytidylyltransferase [Methylobacterium]MCX7336290.1 glucose-1-phosphate cytidylyltransferase [Hyphomicrobiales bacterium]KIU36445.1 glucose-1-phosphate cytidylyltransferase [Methylobacterium radiotolerans]KTS04479.1 glucose-1-phosphate cytidylyltransferase [Methylobacterium radiotolerans]KTS47355.1 glucose-1-phosphate cytidylyltransferase [Methylobacterium radiotolerans]MBP2493762.1 glucose-1-phosphate cytidylyltransferase [Methylobacterium sp. PvP105]